MWYQNVFIACCLCFFVLGAGQWNAKGQNFQSSGKISISLKFGTGDRSVEGVVPVYFYLRNSTGKDQSVVRPKSEDIKVEIQSVDGKPLKVAFEPATPDSSDAAAFVLRSDCDIKMLIGIVRLAEPHDNSPVKTGVFSVKALCRSSLLLSGSIQDLEISAVLYLPEYPLSVIIAAPLKGASGQTVPITITLCNDGKKTIRLFTCLVRTKIILM